VLLKFEFFRNSVEEAELDQDHTQRLVAIIANATDEAEKEAISVWASRLLELRNAGLPHMQKARQAISITTTSKILWPTVKIVGHELKRLGWSERSWGARLGGMGAVVGATAFGGQAAGVAALGTAIGVPLWVVLGSGAAFAGVLIEEFTRLKR